MVWDIAAWGDIDLYPVRMPIHDIRTISKSAPWLLRHGLHGEYIPYSKGGWAFCHDVIRLGVA